MFIFPFVCDFSHSSLPTSFIFLLSHLRSLFHRTLLVLHSCFVIHIAFFTVLRVIHYLFITSFVLTGGKFSFLCIVFGVVYLVIHHCHYFFVIIFVRFFLDHLSVHIFQKLLCCIVAHFSYSSHTLTGFTICIYVSVSLRFFLLWTNIYIFAYVGVCSRYSSTQTPCIVISINTRS